MWFLVSYNRPSQCGDVMQSLRDCGLSTPGKLIVQGRDHERAYRSIEIPSNWSIEVLPQNVGLCSALQKSFREYPSEECYSVLADDEFVHSQGFDRTIIDAAGRWGISHGNDGWRTDQGWYHTLATYGGDLVREVGWWALPRLWHAYFDNAWQDIGAAMGLRRYCTDVRTTHLNVDVDERGGGTAPWDETYRRGRASAERDRSIYETWRRDELPRLLDRLRYAMR